MVCERAGKGKRKVGAECDDKQKVRGGRSAKV